MARYINWRLLAIALAGALLLAACDECERSSDCPTGQVCMNGTCEGGSATFGSDGDTDADGDGDTDTDGDTDNPGAIVWVEIEGGSFSMGSDDAGPESAPAHEVSVPTFEISLTEITMLQYASCVMTEQCVEPLTGGDFNWNTAGRTHHPINGVDWINAVTFCDSVGGRLPSEAEWEYAARSGGLDSTYPWGEDDPTCDYAIMYDGAPGCGESGTWPVCSLPAGSTDDELCDMAGNVWEWTADYFHINYADTPTDGSAAGPPTEGATSMTLRGGGYLDTAGNGNLRTFARVSWPQSGAEPDLGFRCARGGSTDDPDGGVDAGVDGGS
jgi:iron(II)-dependent oxidoreductase